MPISTNIKTQNGLFKTKTGILRLKDKPEDVYIDFYDEVYIGEHLTSDPESTTIEEGGTT